MNIENEFDERVIYRAFSFCYSDSEVEGKKIQEYKDGLNYWYGESHKILGKYGDSGKISDFDDQIKYRNATDQIGMWRERLFSLYKDREWREIKEKALLGEVVNIHGMLFKLALIVE